MASAYPCRTGAVHQLCGEPWEGWQLGVGVFEQRTVDERCAIGANYGKSTYWAKVDGAVVLSDRTHVAKRFQTRSAAAEAAIRARDGA